jgi:hypothetical protein
MKFIYLAIALFAGLVWWMLHGEPNFADTVIVALPVSDQEGLSPELARIPHAMDYQISSDGNGSLRIDASEQTFVNLYRVWGDEADVSFRRLVYAAEVRTENASGPVFLVMQAGLTSVPGGSVPVVGREMALTGTNDWTTLEAWTGNPGGSKLLETSLQLHIDGPGTVWIDDVRLISRQVY